MRDWNYDRALIPNQEWLQIDVLFTNATYRRTEIEIHNGTHRLKGVDIVDVIAWRLSKQCEHLPGQNSCDWCRSVQE